MQRTLAAVIAAAWLLLGGDAAAGAATRLARGWAL
jgi:hypothetical protein